MSDDFTVNNPGMTDVTFDIGADVKQVQVILQGVNGVLNRVQIATSNSGLPLFDDLRTQWNKAYDDMVLRLESGQSSTTEAHNLYKEGDSVVVRIMS